MPVGTAGNKDNEATSFPLFPPVQNSFSLKHVVNGDKKTTFCVTF